jgi:glycosyltransferase involved in cell wall biosynthesis
MNKDISIVVPVYNEEENILSFLIRVVAILEKCKFTYEIIFVLDPSIDRSEEIISNQIKLNKNI